MAPRVVIGLMVVAFGLLLTAGNMGWVDPSQIWNALRYWPLAIVVIGAVKIMAGETRSSRTTGALIAGVGLWILAQQMDLIHIHLMDWWPLLLIAIGVLMVSRARQQWAVGTTGADRHLSDFAFWSGVKRRVTSSSFKHAELTAVMGGIDLDLRPAATEGGEAIIDVFVVMGGVEIIVPPDWTVSNHITTIMGGSEDKSVATQDARHRLILRGFVIMGGVEIKT
jgi:predicted membrane protein